MEDNDELEIAEENIDDLDNIDIEDYITVESNTYFVKNLTVY